MATGKRIPVAGPWITEKEIAYVTEAAQTAWYEHANDFHVRFEKAFAAHLGMKYAITLPSCTSAIHLALAALGIGPGDEVIVPESTWIASAAPVHYVGARPVFADVDPVTWCIDVTSCAKVVTPRTKAIIPVDLYGGMPNWDALKSFASEHQLAVIEDAAEAIGAFYHDQPAGSFGDVGVFSFHGSKTLTTGEGGMLGTNDDYIRDSVLKLRDHGRIAGPKQFWNGEVAFKYKMSALQAALGLAQLERIDELMHRKQQMFACYREQLQRYPQIQINAEPPGTKNGYWMVTAIFDSAMGLTKEEWMKALADHGIDTRPFFYPLSSLPAYAEEPSTQGAQERNPISYHLGKYGLNLPSALNLSPTQIAYVCDTIGRLVRTHSKKQAA